MDANVHASSYFLSVQQSQTDVPHRTHNKSVRSHHLKWGDEGMNPPSHELKVCLVQPLLRGDGQDPFHAVDHVQQLMRTAVQEHGHIDLFVLPELCPIGYSEETFAKYLPTSSDDENRRLGDRLEGEWKNISRAFKTAICYGTMGRRRRSNNDSHDVTIRQVVVDKDGEEIGVYDKIHLCNYGACAETRFFAAGSSLCSFTLGDWKFGILICADMRPPELAQSYVRHHGVHVLLQPAAFARDCSFRTWKSFRETRAVETGCYFLAVNYAGPQFGETSWNHPWIDEDNEPTVLGTEVSYLVETLNPRVLQMARTKFPFYRQTANSNGVLSSGASISTDDVKGR